MHQNKVPREVEMKLQLRVEWCCHRLVNVICIVDLDLLARRVSAEVTAQDVKRLWEHRLDTIRAREGRYSTHADIFRWYSAGRVPAILLNLVVQLERQGIQHRQNQSKKKKRRCSGGGKREPHLQSKQASADDLKWNHRCWRSESAISSVGIEIYL